MEEKMGVVEREDGCCWKRRWMLLKGKMDVVGMKVGVVEREEEILLSDGR